MSATEPVKLDMPDHFVLIQLEHPRAEAQLVQSARIQAPVGLAPKARLL
jgi:hypothetical protein